MIYLIATALFASVTLAALNAWHMVKLEAERMEVRNAARRAELAATYAEEAARTMGPYRRSHRPLLVERLE